MSPRSPSRRLHAPCRALPTCTVRPPCGLQAKLADFGASREVDLNETMEAAAPDVLLEYEPSSRSRVVDHLLAEWRSDCELQPAVGSIL